MSEPKSITKPLVTFLNFGIFPATCMFVVGMDEKKAMESMNKTATDKDSAALLNIALQDLIDHREPCDNYAAKRTLENNGQIKKFYFVFMREGFFGTNESYVTLAHELIHIVQFFSEGVFDRTQEHECEAYLHSHLMQQCLDAITQK